MPDRGGGCQPLSQHGVWISCSTDLNSILDCESICHGLEGLARRPLRAANSSSHLPASLALNVYLHKPSSTSFLSAETHADVLPFTTRFMALRGPCCITLEEKTVYDGSNNYLHGPQNAWSHINSTGHDTTLPSADEAWRRSQMVVLQRADLRTVSRQPA